MVRDFYTPFNYSTRSSSVGPIFIFLQVITKVIPHSDPLREPDEEMLGNQSRNGGDGGDSRHAYACHGNASGEKAWALERGIVNRCMLPVDIRCHYLLLALFLAKFFYFHNSALTPLAHLWPLSLSMLSWYLWKMIGKRRFVQKHTKFIQFQKRNPQQYHV